MVCTAPRSLGVGVAVALAHTITLCIDCSQECSADVLEAFIATIDNSTYFNTCAENTTFNVSSVFDVLSFTDTEFLSSTCLEPIHALMESQDYLITCEGSARDLSDEVSKIHDQCHEVLDAAGEEMDMGGHTHSSGSTASASSSSDVSSVVMAVASVVCCLPKPTSLSLL
eukprot:jgi/Phyca11/536045/estExt2_fgenesh1_pg.C_PHYCAscaffold_460087